MLGSVLVLGAALGGLTAARHAIAEAQTEARLDGVYGLDARVDGAHLSLIDRHIQLHGLVINPALGEVPEDMVYVETVDIYVQGPLAPWAGSTAQVTLDGVDLHLRVGEDAANSQASLDARTIEELRELSPWPVDELHIERGRGRYLDPARKFDIDIEDLRGHATNLVRARDRFSDGDFEANGAEIELHARLEDSAKLTVTGRARLDRPDADFHVHATIAGFPLESVEPMIYEDKKIEVEDGYVAIDADLQGRDGAMQGWISPNFERVDFEAALREGLAAPLNAIGERAKSELLDDPIDPSRDDRIHVAGSYGAKGIHLHATKENNSLIQRLLFDAGAQRLR